MLVWKTPTCTPASSITAGCRSGSSVTFRLPPLPTRSTIAGSGLPLPALANSSLALTPSAEQQSSFSVYTPKCMLSSCTGGAECMQCSMM